MRRFSLLISLIVISIIANCQVSPQTGSATFSIPMFDWKDNESRLSTVVALSYNSGFGLKVDHIPSCVGEGWNLISGGVITRMPIGQPDDQKPMDGSIDDLSKYPPGYLYDPLSAEDGCPTWLAKYPIFKHRNKIYKQHNSVAADKELDRFSFQFNGRSGMFVLGKDNGDKGITIGDSKVKIWFTRDESMINDNIRTTINAFYIQDENGVIYKFSQLERTKILKTRYCDPTFTHPRTAPEFKNNKVYHEADFDDAPSLSYVVNSWHLTEIKDPFTERKIEFEYGVFDINANSGVNISIFNSNKNYAIVSNGKSISKSPYLNTIHLPDEHSVKFVYGDERFDLKGSRPLSAVEIKYKSRFIAKYLLKTNYFVYNRITHPVTDFQKRAARLCLQSVQKVTADLKGIEPPYLFNYYTGSSAEDDFVPPPFFHLKDIWGFYNGNYSKDFFGNDIPVNEGLSNLNYNQLKGVCFLRNNSTELAINTKPGYAKNGLLKQINYPTGGYLQFEYADNVGSINSSQDTYIGGVHVSRIRVNDGGYAQDCTPNDLVTDYTYVKSDGVTSSMWDTEMPSNKIESSSFYEPEVKRYQIPIFGGCGILGCCKYKYQYPGILSRDQAIDLTGGQAFLESLTAAVSALGDMFTIGSVLVDATSASVAGLAFSIYMGLITIIQTCFMDMSRTFESNVFYNINLAGMNPLPKQFKRVVATESSGSNNGYTVMEFTSDEDYSVWENSNPLRTLKQRYATWAYGLPKRVAVYNNIGNIVSETINAYDYENASSNISEIYDETGKTAIINTDYTSCNCVVEKSSSKRSTEWNNPNNDPNSFIKTNNVGDDIRADFYTFKTGRVFLKFSVERQYSMTLQDPNPMQGDFMEKKIEYKYESPTLQPSSIKTKLSNGDEIIEDIVYTGDANVYSNNKGAVLQSLLINNVLSMPISIVKSVKKASGGSDFKILNEKVTRYNALANGDIKPSFIYENRFSEPSTPLRPANVYKGPLSMSNPDYKTLQRFSYDNNGNVVNVKDEGGRQVSYIYDYDNKFVVATIVNADQVFGKGYSTYSSFETESFGGWQLEGTADYDLSNAVTGERSFNLKAENALYTNASHPEPFVLSFWATDNNFTITNASSTATLKKAAPEINGFTYYEFELPNIESYVMVQGNTTIDELRLYPQEGRMSTVTYDPIIGKTSECDENNRVTRFEYDNMGRLRFVKDDWNNVLKMYEYNNAVNYINPDCPTSNITYYNDEMFEIFRKNDCEGNTIGSEVTYTVPAGSYSSSISQDHANLLAQNQINELGQVWANNSSGSICMPVYYNEELSDDFIKEDCDFGFVGDVYTYVVPAGRYFSFVDLAEANALAQDEINSNGQAYANFPGNVDCIVTYDPQWEATGVHRCDGTVIEYQMQDMNPNSSTYNQTYWHTDADNPDCGGAPVPVVYLTYINNSNAAATIELKNLSDNMVYQFSLNSNVTTQQTTGAIPLGTYEVTITMPWGSSASSIMVYTTTQSGSYYYSASQSFTTAGSPIIVISN